MNQSYSGMMDGGNAMLELKSTGPNAALFISIKVHELQVSRLYTDSNV